MMDQPNKVRDHILELTQASEAEMEALDRYVSLLIRWNKTHNVIARGEENQLWERHILDCAQLIPILRNHSGDILDVGSGGGLPGIIMAIFLDRPITLVESNQKKSIFLREVKRELNLHTMTILNNRIEHIDQIYDIITCRAFANIDRFLELTHKNFANNHLCLLLKGCKAEAEIQKALENWRFTSTVEPSISHDENDGHIVQLKDVKRISA